MTGSDLAAAVTAPARAATASGLNERGEDLSVITEPPIFSKITVWRMPGANYKLSSGSIEWQGHCDPGSFRKHS